MGRARVTEERGRREEDEERGVSEEMPSWDLGMGYLLYLIERGSKL